MLPHHDSIYSINMLLNHLPMYLIAESGQPWLAKKVAPPLRKEWEAKLPSMCKSKGGEKDSPYSPINFKNYGNSLVTVALLSLRNTTARPDSKCWVVGNNGSDGLEDT
jgi:hypothetical protein